MALLLVICLTLLILWLLSVLLLLWMLLQLLLLVVHALRHIRLRRHQSTLLRLTVPNLLLLLREIAWTTEACAQTISATIALQAVLVADVAALLHLDDPLAAAAHEGEETAALGLN